MSATTYAGTTAYDGGLADVADGAAGLIDGLVRHGPQT